MSSLSIKVRLSMNTKGWDKIQRNLTRGAGNYTNRVGFFKGSYEHATVPQVAAWQEEGTSIIPPRPFIRMGLMKKVENGLVLKHIPKVNLIASGKMTWRQLNKELSKDLVEALQESILYWDDPMNRPSTIAKKGFDDPLIGLTGKLFNNVESKVVRRGYVN